MSSQITGGTFTYLRRSKTGDYEHNEATVNLNFNLGDGDENGESFLDKAAAIAVAKVNQVLGTRPVAALPAPAIGAALLAAAVAPPKEPAAEPAAPKALPRRRGSTKPPVLDVGTITQEEIAAQVAETRAAEANAADMSEVEPNISATPEDRKDPNNAADMASVEDWEAPLDVEVTDKQLIDAISRKNAELNQPQRIRAVIAKFVAPPGTYRQIPAEARAKFLQELSAVVQ